MRNLSTKLPPMKSLVVFEAAARHLSLTRAGEELRVSREAVSRHIRVLEEHLGVKLFDRLHRAVALTPPGQKFQAVVLESLENIAGVSATISQRGDSSRITVSATIAISSFWLTPRLARFRAIYPEVEIHVAISDRPADLESGEVDVGLRYGDGQWPGLNAIHLFDVDSFPVCSPDYLAGAPPLSEPADLLNHTLVNLDGSTHAAEDWWWWLKEQNVPAPESLGMLGLDSYDNVIQLAVKGEGVALGFSGIVDDFLADGRLVRPITATLSRNNAVYALIPAMSSPSAAVRNFVDWIVEEAGNNESTDK
jgi:LysR family glycine cleavage system transcriptional activator